jgi:Beta-propeller repeat
VKHRRGMRLLAFVGTTVALGAGSFIAPQATGAALGVGPQPGHSATKTEQARVRQTFDRMPLQFVQNRGKLDPRVALYAQGSSSAIYFTSTGAMLSALGTQPAGAPALVGQGPAASARPYGWSVEQRFLNASAVVWPVGADRMAGIASYFQGSRTQWQTGLASYGKVIYRGVWPGIDVVYSGSASHLEYTFVVHPGADPRDIALAYQGASGVRIDPSGQLAVSTPVGGFVDQPPVAYQMAAGRRIPVTAAFQAADSPSGGFGYGFSLGSFDRSRTLVIDPVTNSYSGYIGGYLQDIGLAIAIDTHGNAYVAGQTNSSEVTFPVKVGPFLHNKGQTDVFVCKTSTAGQLVYCGYIGGASSDRGRGIAVDSAGEAYVIGWTRSQPSDGFPVTVGPALKYYGGSSDAFIAKVSADGTHLIYCGYLGGSDHDEGKNVALDSSGNAYVTGGTKSLDWSTDEIPASGVAQPQPGGAGDAFVVEVSSAGQYVTGTYIGGACESHCGTPGSPAKKGGPHNGDDHARGIAVISSGSAAGVYVNGDTHSQADTFKPVVGPSLIYGGNGDAFAAKLPLDLSVFDYKGYVGGSQYEDMRDNAVDSQGYDYMCGHTSSKDFPLMNGWPGSNMLNGVSDGFVAKIKPDGTGLVFSGLIGGTSQDSCYGINVNAAGTIFIAGHTNSKLQFPVKNVDGYPDSLGTTYSGSGDGFVAGIKGDGTQLLFSGYFGGYDIDVIWASDLDANGDLVLTGTTHSGQNSKRPFPLKVGPDLYYNGAGDGFVSLIDVGGVG